MKEIRKAVIPCAGYGTRFLPITKVIPKELLPIGNKPAIQFVVEEAVQAGIEEIILVCNRSKASILDYFRPDPGLNAFLKKRGKEKERKVLKGIESLAKFTEVYQKSPRGLGDAILCAREAVGREPFLVMLPDVLILEGEGEKTPSIRSLVDACEGNGDWGVLLGRVSRERMSSYGIVGGGDLGSGRYEVRRAVEKPRPEGAPSDLALLGRYLFTTEIFEGIAKSGPGALGEIQLTDAINALAVKKPGLGIVCRGRVLDVGNPEGLMEAGRVV